MGRINLLCNMEQEEADRRLEEFDQYITNEEEEYISETFKHYLFYQSWENRNIRSCVCTHCGCGAFDIFRDEKPEFFGFTHGDDLHCPMCHEPVNLIAVGRMKSFGSLEQMQRLTICRTATDGALMLTSGWGIKRYSHYDLRPTVDFSEKVRTVLLPGKRMQWKMTKEWYCGRSYDAGWVQQKAVAEPFNPSMYTSDGSSYFIFPERVKDSLLKYCQLEDWYHEITREWLEDMQVPSRDVVRFLSAYTEYPNIEMTVKLGLPDAVEDLVCQGLKNGRYLNWKGKTPAEFLRMSKQDARAFMGSDTRMPQLRIYHELKKEGSVVGFQDFLNMVAEMGGSRIVVRINDCAKSVGLTLKEAANYIGKHCAYDRDKSSTVQLWKDYIDMATRLGYDMSRRDVIMPKNLQQRHDDAAATIKIQKNAEEVKTYSARYKKLKKLYEFELDGLCIVVPTCTEDIVQEGKTLHHCVGGYAARHIKGALDILFLRNKRKPGTPFITIEMKSRKNVRSKVETVQIHGYKNESYKHAVKPSVRYSWFFEAWYAWMRAGSKRDKNGKPILAEKEKTA